MMRPSLLLLAALCLGTFDTPAQTIDPKVTSPVSPLTIYAGGPPQPIDLYTEAVRFTTDLGTIDVGLFGQHTPITVANFLKYVDEGRYFLTDPTTHQLASSFIHRALPGFVIQGGNFIGTVDPQHPTYVRATTVPAFAAIQNEPGISNRRGTIAMAKLPNDPNSATSNWFINLADNGGSPNNLDTTDGGFTAFGRVLGGGMAVADAISNVPHYSFGPSADSIPLRNYSTADYNSGKPITVPNLVSIPGITHISSLTFSASSNDPSVSVTISGTRLLVQGNHVGSAQVTVTATGSGGATLSETFTVNVIAMPGHLANISTRLQVGTGQDVLIAGFIVRGGTSKHLMVRGIGPSLTSNGQPLPGRLANPRLELHDPSKAIIATSDNWRDNNQQEIIDTQIAPSNDLESAILTNVPSSDNGVAYTAVLQGADGGTGIGSVEVYDLESGPGSVLVNISTRGQVGTDNNVLIGGFIITGNDAKKLLIRGIGPSLQASGISGALANPTLDLHDGNGNQIAFNDDWGSSDDAAAIQATGAQPSDPKESAILRTLTPAAYTAIVRGLNNTTGVGSIEVYQLD